MPTFEVEGPDGQVVEVEGPNAQGAARAARDYFKQASQGQGSFVGGNNSFMGQVNAGIGDVIDFVNPFDNEVWEGTPLHTPSAGEFMRGLGVQAATQEPQGMVEGFARGTGEAAGSLVPVVKGLKMMSAAQNLPASVRAFADDAVKSLASTGGAITEMIAGGTSRGASEGVEEAGGGQTAQMAAAVLAPTAALPALTYGANAGGRAVGKLANAAVDRFPVAGTVKNTIGDVASALAPQSEAGAMRIAGNRVKSAVGRDRADEVAGSLREANPMQLSPARLSGDANLIGLENAARAQDPSFNAAREAAETASRGFAVDDMRSMGGDVADARSFMRENFAQRSKAISDQMQTRIEDAFRGAEADIPKGAISPSQKSTAVADRLAGLLDDAKYEQRQLWGAIPMQDNVDATQTRSAIDRLIEGQAWAQRDNIPNDLRVIADGGSPIDETTTIKELHGLYSQMRQVARNAVSGTQKNDDTARVANAVAEAVLDDLSRIPDEGSREAIDRARAFSRVMHEKFDQGAVGRILQRKVAGDNAIEPATALRSTVARGKEAGSADTAKILAVSPESRGDIKDYLGSVFAETAINPETGMLDRKAANTWLKRNRETLNQYPDLRSEVRRALQSDKDATAYAIKAKARAELQDVGGPVKRFIAGKEGDAVKTILTAENPQKAARSLVATARKDKTGAAMAGLKGAFLDNLIGDAPKVTGDKIAAVLRAPDFKGAARQIFSKKEIANLNRMATHLSRLDMPGREVGEVMNSPAHKLLETVFRIAGAKTGSAVNNATAGPSGAGTSLQAAGMGSARAQELLNRLTNSRAQEIVFEALNDHELMETLLTTTKGPEIPGEVLNRLAPYIIGAGAGAEQE